MFWNRANDGIDPGMLRHIGDPGRLLRRKRYHEIGQYEGVSVVLGVDEREVDCVSLNHGHRAGRERVNLFSLEHTALSKVLCEEWKNALLLPYQQRHGRHGDLSDARNV